MDEKRVKPDLGALPAMIYWIMLMVTMFVTWSMIWRPYIDGLQRGVGRATGYAVVEQTTRITSDPTANYLIPATNTTLPPAAPGADR